jgi:putative oxidoreductase
LGISGLSGAPIEPVASTEDWLATAGGVFLFVGLWTPITGAVLAIEQLWLAFSRSFPDPSYRWIHILLAVLSAGVAMLGPGAWSLDARVFGRKRFDIGDRTRGRKPSP